MGVIILIVATCSGPVGDWRSRNIVAPLYRPPDRAALATITELFKELLQSRAAALSTEAWQAAGFVAEWRAEAGTVHLSVREPAGQIDGKGRYLLRPDGALTMAIQAPHGDTDLHTAEIAQLLFLQTAAVAAAFNTLPRWAVDVRGQPADLATRTDSALLAFTHAFVDRYPDGIVVQLHGFDGAKRESLIAAIADVIVSDGTRQPSRQIAAVRDCLAGVVSGRVLLYGDDILELGGTGNVVGRAIRDSGAGRFLHVEMSLPLRRRLLGEGPLRSDFVRCLAGGVGA